MTPAATRDQRQRRHVEMLVLAAIVLVGSALLEVRADGRIAPAGFSQWPLLEVCPTKLLLGQRCPCCGLTHSFVSLTRGDVAGSLAAHRVGWILFAALALQIPYRAAALHRPEQRLLPDRVANAIAFALIAILVGSWLFDLARNIAAKSTVFS